MTEVNASIIANADAVGRPVEHVDGDCRVNVAHIANPIGIGIKPSEHVGNAFGGEDMGSIAEQER